MTQTQHKLRAVILAALMVLSVFAISFAGTAVADNRENNPRRISYLPR
jgi:surface glycoprotein (TIGR04207 family)